MTAIVGTRTTHDDITLATRHWAVADPRAAIVLVHGLAEHTGRYDHVADRFASRGFDVRGTDLRGFGRSGGDRAYVEDFSEYTTDLANDITAARDLGVPVVLLGHSLGGLIAILYATEDHPQPDLLVLSAPAVDAELPRVKALAAKALGRVLPRLKVSNGLKAEQLSRDPTVGERYFADPLVFPKSTVRLATAFMDAAERARDSLERIAQPTLVVHGGSDTIVEPRFSEPVGRLPGATRVVFNGFRHESFNEEGGTLAATTIADWISDQS